MQRHLYRPQTNVSPKHYEKNNENNHHMQSAVMLHSPECPGRSSLDSIPVRRLRTRRIQRPKRKDSNQTPIYQFHNGEEARQNRCRHGRKERQKCVLLSDKVREKKFKRETFIFLTTVLIARVKDLSDSGTEKRTKPVF